MNATLNLVDFAAISPLLIILGASLLMLLIETFAGAYAKKISTFVVLAALIVGLFASIVSPASENALLIPWLHFDAFSRVFTIFFMMIGIGSTLLASSFFQRFHASCGEYYFLLFAALFGLILIAASADFLTLFLGIETLSIPLYILCGYMKQWKISHEAAIKFFLIGALATALLLYGIAMIYGATGTTNLNALLPAYHAFSDGPEKALFLSGIALVTLGLAFKAAIVPFHLWAPDVYDGAPTPITAFMAVGTKVGAFAAFGRVFLVALPQFDPIWNEAMAWLAYPTLVYANIVALRQTQLRRFFAYSGISHSGFLLIPLAVGTVQAVPALVFYLAVYALSTFGAFAVIAILDQRSEGVMLRDLSGLFRRSPYLAVILTICLLTLAGIPPTIGFFAKFYLFQLAFNAGYYMLVIVGLLTTILSAFYYLRIAAMMFEETSEEMEKPRLLRPALFVGTASLAILIAISCYPGPFMDLIAASNTIYQK